MSDILSNEPSKFPLKNMLTVVFVPALHSVSCVYFPAVVCVLLILLSGGPQI